MASLQSFQKKILVDLLDMKSLLNPYSHIESNHEGRELLTVDQYDTMRNALSGVNRGRSKPGSCYQ